MREIAKFVLSENLYLCRQAKSHEMQILAMHLDTDVSLREDDFFTEWIDDPKRYGVSSNATSVERNEEGTIIEIRDVLDNEEGPAFRMPKEEYRKMVLKWQELCKQKPKEIIIIWDGQNISVEGRD